ncbi:uncharacterized protein PRCAT00004652001 [Priceomyces carsonii]|uniref:uncharacterized protein n=1 Tax=Priceomyces carsonii TaxID=28549 RepID=UPI002ED7C61B|nr:unnamed protein product [Priceomyces carsonii]
MSLSRRICIEWPPEVPEEETKTMVFTSPQNHFVDVRIYKNRYPYLSQDTNVFLDDLFQWCMSGVEEPIYGTNKIKFLHDVDSQVISKSIKLHIPLHEAVGEPDIGDFSLKTESGDRIETGLMINPASSLKQDYVEIWRSLDPNQHTPTIEVKEKCPPEEFDVTVLKVSSDRYEGKVIKLGNWTQGILHDKHNLKMPLHVIRSFFNSSTHQTVPLIQYGDMELFPADSDYVLNSSIHINDTLTWKCIEK